MELEGELPTPWAQLVSTENVETEKDKEVVHLVGDTLTIGRKPDVDFVIANKHVSGSHCMLIRSSSKTGRPALKDTSTNGTLLNGQRVAKDTEVDLKDGDLISLVYRKDDPKWNVAFRFEGLLGNVNENENVASNDDEEQDTQIVDDDKDVTEKHNEDKMPDNAKRKRPLEESGEEPVAKVPSLSPSLSTVLHGITQPEGGDTLLPELAKKDSMEETLICQICQEILHDCVSLQPCMHSYCAGCYSDWMVRSQACPACRKKVKRISKNHIVNNLVEAYLRGKPEKVRPKEDLEELDAKNLITNNDMLYPKKDGSKHASKDESVDESDSSGNDGDDDYYDNSDSHDNSDSSASLSPLASSVYPLALPSFCLQCPGYSGVIHFPHFNPPPYTCSHSTSHTMCHCCLRSMPVRTDDPTIVQKCNHCLVTNCAGELCNRFYCHQYWHCTKPSCHGCITRFKDMNFASTDMNGILGNAYECTILKRYMDSRGLTLRDVLRMCCYRMTYGTYTYSDTYTHTALSQDTYTCHVCALTALKTLAHHYRRDIPNKDLPTEVTKRPDCHWGKECRTQFNNFVHAMKYNHVCEKKH